MRNCLTCGLELDKASVFCPACGSKVPPASQPTAGSIPLSHVADAAGHAPEDGVVRVGNVDPLASTSPASFSPARKPDPIESRAASSPVSPKAGTGLLPSHVRSDAAPPVSPARPSAQKPSTRGKTVPLSALKNPPQIAVKPATPQGAPAVAASPGPQPRQPMVAPPSPPAFAAAARMSPAPAPAPRASAPRVAPVAPAAAPVAPAAMPPFPPGRRVLVQWANGQSYPGVVEQLNGAVCLVRFDAGEQRWVELRFVSPG